ncbi:hypothetical protein D1007_29600 [Hordeum vulgare]|nr:hypothetical protein D1007_29600 [Hordeum vulgare]
MSTTCSAPGTPSSLSQVCRRTRVHGLTSTLSSSRSPSPPPPPRMTEEEEARLVQRVMEDSMNTYDERQWVGLEEMMALSVAGDVAIPEEQPVAFKEEVHEEHPVVAFPSNLVGQRWTRSCTAMEMGQGVGVEPWCPTPSRSPERESLPRREMVQASPAPPTFQEPPAHLWTMSSPAVHRPHWRQ